MPKFLKRKRNIWIIVIVVVIIIILFFVFRGNGSNSSVQTGTVTKQNLQETVLATGQVVSGTDLNLGFQTSGVVQKVSVQEGDTVSQGQILATLDESSALANLTQAQANYDKLINGATSNDIQASQDAVDSAKVNLSNAYSGALNAINNGYTAIFNADAVAKSIQDAYFTAADSSWSPVHENKANIDNQLVIIDNSLTQAGSSSTLDSAVSSASGALASVLASLQVIRDQTNTDTYILRVTDADKASLDSQKSAVSSALSGVNTVQSNIASSNVALQTAEHNLSAKQSAPRPEDVESAQGQVDAAQAVVNNLIITAPMSGTITQVDVKVGELAMPSQEAIVLQNISDLHAEADVSEANIATLQVGQPIDYTFDALGPDQHFAGKVLTVNPASTVISGVVDYLVKGSFENVPGIKPGMTANMTILVAKKDNALAVPSTAIINKDNNQYVRVVDNPKTKSYHQVQVQTGLQADGGMVEITSGLNEGQEIVTYVKP